MLLEALHSEWMWGDRTPSPHFYLQPLPFSLYPSAFS